MLYLKKQRNGQKRQQIFIKKLDPLPQPRRPDKARGAASQIGEHLPGVFQYPLRLEFSAKKPEGFARGHAPSAMPERLFPSPAVVHPQDARRIETGTAFGRLSVERPQPLRTDPRRCSFAASGAFRPSPDHARCRYVQGTIPTDRPLEETIQALRQTA